MAEIPIEKKSGSKWLWILLALLALALIAWWILDDDGDDVVEYTDQAVVADTVPAATGMLVVGESVDMDGVEVTSLAGDMAFYIEMNGQQVPVFFDQVPTPGDATEGEYDINPGSILNIEGEVRSATDTLPANADPSILGQSQNYIFAESIEMVGS
tara:strand:+ start:7265 stop:7732 length:468 start_codon:yes stop_codon:yes gene_type:complete